MQNLFFAECFTAETRVLKVLEMLRYSPTHPTYENCRLFNPLRLMHFYTFSIIWRTDLLNSKSFPVLFTDTAHHKQIFKYPLVFEAMLAKHIFI